MNITYEREISHCEKTNYVKDVTIKEVNHAENSDFLDIVSFEEMGWNAIVRRDSYKSGDLVFFIPPDSVLPFELSESLEVTKYLSKGRVRVTRLRGNRSEGLVVDKEKVLPYLDYILKWEDPPSIQMRGETMPSKEVPYEFEKFYKMPNILNEPYTFRQNELISHSEKIHGTNVRMGILKNPETNEYQLYVGSHEIVLKESDENIYWKVVKEKLADKLPKDIVFYGEIFGPGIQHLHYEKKEPDILLFNASRNGIYMLWEEFLGICGIYDLPHVIIHIAKYKDIEQIRSLADEPSEYTETHYREGIVICSGERPGIMAKCIGFKYLTEKDGKKKRTERH